MTAVASPDPAALARLHDLVVAPPVPWWPPAPGWYGVALLVFALAAWVAWRTAVRHRADRYRRLALDELERLRSRANDSDGRAHALGALPELLKRTALEAWPREKVAGLTGDTWAAFLDETARTQAFRQGPGRALLDLAHRPSASREATHPSRIDGWFALAETWVRTHRRPGSTP